MAQGARFGPDETFIFSVTGLILAVPAALLPFVGAGKLGDERMSHLFTGVGALWDNGMQEVAVGRLNVSKAQKIFEQRCE